MVSFDTHSIPDIWCLLTRIQYQIYGIIIWGKDVLSKNANFARAIVLTFIKRHKFLTMYCYYNERHLNTFFKHHFYFKNPVWGKITLFWFGILFQDYGIWRN